MIKKLGIYSNENNKLCLDFDGKIVESYIIKYLKNIKFFKLVKNLLFFCQILYNDVIN